MLAVSKYEEEEKEEEEEEEIEERDNRVAHDEATTSEPSRTRSHDWTMLVTLIDYYSGVKH